MVSKRVNSDVVLGDFPNKFVSDALGWGGED